MGHAVFYKKITCFLNFYGAKLINHFFMNFVFCVLFMKSFSILRLYKDILYFLPNLKKKFGFFIPSGIEFVCSLRYGSRINFSYTNN